MNMDKILVVCANGDRPLNLQMTKHIVEILVKNNYIPNKTYELISMNPDEITKEVVFDKNIKSPFPDNSLKDEEFQVVIFQGCMTCMALHWTKDISVFKDISQIYRIIKNDGLFVGVTKCYYNGEDNILENVKERFTLLNTYNTKGIIGMPPSIDVWRKK
jgi:hypothetical protein